MKAHHRETLAVKEIRPMVFGIEDSLVSTLGVVVGIAAAGQSTQAIVTAGIILVVIEAVSMAAGEFLSSQAEEDVAQVQDDGQSPAVNAVVMGISYIIAGFAVLWPYFVTTHPLASILATLSSAIGIFSLGVWKAYLTRKPRTALRSGAQMLAIAGVAAIIGFLLGLGLRAVY